MQARVANLLRVLGSCEIEIERVRHEIVDAAGGQLDRAYYFIEKNSDGYMTVSHLTEFLSTNEVQAENDEVQAIIDQYDLTGRGSLSYEDYIRAIKPQDWNQKRFSERINYKEQNLKNALVKFFTKELGIIRKINEQITKIESKEWTSFDTYKCLDVKGNGSFTYEDLDHFLQRSYIVLPHIDLRAAFRRIDKNGNGSVTYKELSETLFNETHLEHISENCCPGKTKLEKSPPRKRKELAKINTEKSLSESSPPQDVRKSFVTTYQTNNKSDAEVSDKDPISRNIFSSQRLFNPRVYDGQAYFPPARPVAAEYYAHDNVDRRFPESLRYRAVVTTPAVGYRTVGYVRPVQTAKYDSPPFYSTQTTLEKPVTSAPASVYQSGFQRNKTFNAARTHLPIKFNPVYKPLLSKSSTSFYKHSSIPVQSVAPVVQVSPNNRPLSSMSTTQEHRNTPISYAAPSNYLSYNSRPLYFIRDETRGVYDYHSPRKHSPAVEGYAPVQAFTVESPNRRFSPSPFVARQPVISRSPSPVKVNTITRVYDPARPGSRNEPSSHYC